MLIKTILLPFLLTLISFSGLKAEIFTVTNTKDEGAGTLREAIQLANKTPGLDTINFNIKEEAPHNITIYSALPHISDAIFIDGYSQYGSQYGNLLVILTCSYDITELIDGLTLVNGANFSTIRGLVINDFTGYGLVIDNCRNLSIQGNYIGTNETGLIAMGNKKGGIVIRNRSENIIIGGDNIYTRNLVSGNKKSGIIIESFSSDIKIKGNYIGTDISGNNKLKNYDNGIFIEKSKNIIIGGEFETDGNIISGNKQSGISVVSGSDHVVIRNNYIGTNQNGQTKIGNSENGIFIEQSKYAIIGGLINQHKNVINCNSKSGIVLETESDNCIIRGNIIGLLFNGKEYGNGENGIFVENSKNVIIGGKTEEERNIISNNGQSGIVLFNKADSSLVCSNHIGLGIKGKEAYGNAKNGIYVEGSINVIIGGSNYICDNENGIHLSDESKNCIIENNYIGSNTTNENDYPNIKSCILVENANDILIRKNNLQGNVGVLTKNSNHVLIEYNNTNSFFVILLFILLTNVLLYITYKKHGYNYYIIYAISIVIATANLNGIYYELYLPPWITNNSFIPVTLGLLLITLSAYIVKNLYFQNKKRISHIALLIFVFSCVGYMFSLLSRNQSLEVILSHLIIISATIYVIRPLIRSFKKRYLPTFFYILAWIPLFIGAIVNILNSQGIFFYDINTWNSIHSIASICEIILLSIGLTYKINIMKEENKKAETLIENYIELHDKPLETLTLHNYIKQTDEDNETAPFIHHVNKDELRKYLLTPLTDREKDVLVLIAKGKSNKKIAEELFISVNTVKTHILKIYEKLDVNNRIQAISKSISLNIIKKE